MCTTNLGVDGADPGDSDEDLIDLTGDGEGPQGPYNRLVKIVAEDIFGITPLRPQQLSVIEAILAGKDCVAVLGTGAGKSVCYQIPVLVLPAGVAVIVCPTLSLIQDQVEGLLRRGIRALGITSDQPDSVHLAIYEMLARDQPPVRRECACVRACPT